MRTLLLMQFSARTSIAKKNNNNKTNKQTNVPSIASFQCHAIQNKSKSKSKPFNRLRPEYEKRKKVTIQRPSPRFRPQKFFLRGDARYAEKLFGQIYRDLHGDAMLMPIRMVTNMAAGNQQKHLSLSFSTKA